MKDETPGVSLVTSVVKSGRLSCKNCFAASWLCRSNSRKWFRITSRLFHPYAEPPPLAPTWNTLQSNAVSCASFSCFFSAA